jgi:hypothetical protein
MTSHSNPPTVLEAFGHCLPLLDRKPGIGYTSAGSSSITTRNAVPPEVLVCQESKEFIQEVNRALGSRTIKRSYYANNKAPSKQSSLLASEGDVVRESTTHVLNTICEILKTLWPDQWYLQSEKSEMPIRPDVIFQKRDGDGTTGTAIAILEYKKLGNIKFEDFEEILLCKGISPRAVKEALDNTEEGGTFTGNAIVYSKQVSVYARLKECPRVALFNWDHLLLYNFNLQDNKEPYMAGSKADLVWVQETNDADEFIGKCPIRKALLGWLLVAFREKLGPSRYLLREA